MSIWGVRKLRLRETKWSAQRHSAKENRARVQIQVFGFQVQILGSFLCSPVWAMLVAFEMPVGHSY